MSLFTSLLDLCGVDIVEQWCILCAFFVWNVNRGPSSYILLVQFSDEKKHMEGPVNDGFYSKERLLNFSFAGPSSGHIFRNPVFLVFNRLSQVDIKEHTAIGDSRKFNPIKMRWILCIESHFELKILSHIEDTNVSWLC
jgi:hypothetical protein